MSNRRMFMSRNRIAVALLVASIAGFAAMQAQAQGERTLEEVKAEAQARADRNAYPLIGLKPGEVREALGRLHSLDRDEWAASWSEIGDRYMAKKDYEGAWRYYSFARWPQPNSPGKRSEEHTSELQSHSDLVCRLLLEKKKNKKQRTQIETKKKKKDTRNTTKSTSKN